MSEHPLMLAISAARLELIEAHVKEKPKPDDWHEVDRLVACLFNDYIISQTAQTGLVMAELIRHGVEPSDEFRLLFTKSQVITTALCSLVLAHFEVILENGRSVNDAHLHFDRVHRAAEDGQEIIVTQIMGEG